MLLLGLDIGTSSIKVAVTDAITRKCIATAQYPETEREIIALQHGWAEQDPMQWWSDVKLAIQKLHATKTYNPADIKAIGIAYQMHGLVLVNQQQEVLRKSIIWCDSRAVPFGEKAFEDIGEEKCLQHLLNSPGNFTAAKLAWVKANEPTVYDEVDKVLLPGDFIAMMLTGNTTTTISALSEGIFWDFKNNCISKDVLNYFGFDESLIPRVQDVFSNHGELQQQIADELQLSPGIPVSYKAGDQPNNALSLNVLQPGEVAATAGTSGVVYAVTDKLFHDQQSRVNSFAHVNHTFEQQRIGVLLCINGTGILNKWMKQMAGGNFSYNELNNAAHSISPGSDGLMMLPFGNGAERMLNNKLVGAHIHNIDLNKHGAPHLFRAVQESIAFAFRYGIDMMKENGLQPGVIKAGKANMFLSDVFTSSFVNATNIPVELYNCDGSVGASIGAGIGAGYFAENDAFNKVAPIQTIEPVDMRHYDDLYAQWKDLLQQQFQTLK